MRGITTSHVSIEQIKFLRSQGKSISEISLITQKSKSVVSRYIQDVEVDPKFKDILLAKQGGSTYRAQLSWDKKKNEVDKIFESFNKNEKLLILACLYWGEGTKRELNIINSDPSLLRIVVSCFKELGIPEAQIKATIRIYDDINKDEALQFWSHSLKISPNCFKNVNVLNGKKKGKLKYGMCRIRVEKGAEHFKLIISIIDRIKTLLP